MGVSGISLAEQAAALLGMTLAAEQEAQFDAYARELIDWNTRINLTAITAPDDVAVKHFLDSLTLVRAVDFRPGMRLIDVGSGAGFPGLPLAIVEPRLHVTLLEATGKKVAFLDHVVGVLGLSNVETLHARAEDAGHQRGRREAYDVVVARAVARLPSLLEYLLPLAKVGGWVVAMKGRTAHDEAADSNRALAELGGRMSDILPVELPGVDDTHYLVVVEKVMATPMVYPRKPGTPTQKPL